MMSPLLARRSARPLPAADAGTPGTNAPSPPPEAALTATAEREAPTVAFLPWGNVIEDYLDAIGVTLDEFCTTMTGGWFFGYVEALRQTGVRPVVICYSAQVQAPRDYEHVPTGTTFTVLPSGRLYARVRRRMRDPRGWSTADLFGAHRGPRRWYYEMVRSVAPYLATPALPLVRTLKRHRCSAILCQEYEYARFDVCLVIGRLLRVPVFATFQGGDRPWSRLEGLLRPLTIRASAGLFIGASAESERVERVYGVARDRIHSVYNPLDVEEWRPVHRTAARARLGLPREASIAVWHGRVEMRQKGLDLLVDAWDHVIRRAPGADFRLMLIGTGSDAAVLRQRLEAMGGDRVVRVDRFLLDHALLRDYLSAADVYVFPSRHEGFAVAPLEAMACGLPVVAADVAGIAETLGRGEESGGVIVPRDDARAFGDALGRLLADLPRARELGKNARKRAEAFFSTEATAARLHHALAAHSVTREHPAGSHALPFSRS